MAIRVIITGASGMVGEGVLLECLRSAEVEKILVVTRKSAGYSHPKLSELILPDFFNSASMADQLRGYDACFFCLGVSSVGMKKEEYEKLTYNLTMSFAQTLASQNPGMVFCYVSGAGTDTLEKSRLHWARVKGKTENDLQKLGFKRTYLFRPGMLTPTQGSKNVLPAYKWFGWLEPVIKTLMPNSVSSLAQLGQAMIEVAVNGSEKNVLEVRDIKSLSLGPQA